LVCLPFRKYERERKEREIGSYGKMDVRRFWGGTEKRDRTNSLFFFCLSRPLPPYPRAQREKEEDRYGRRR